MKPALHSGETPLDSFQEAFLPVSAPNKMSTLLKEVVFFFFGDKTKQNKKNVPKDKQLIIEISNLGRKKIKGFQARGQPIHSSPQLQY